MPGRSALPHGPPVSEDPPAVGSIQQGAVRTVKPFGVFVQLKGYRKHVLVHHSQVRPVWGWLDPEQG